MRSTNPNDYIDPHVTESLRHMLFPIVLEHLNTIRFPQIKSSSGNFPPLLPPTCISSSSNSRFSPFSFLITFSIDFIGKVEYTLDNLHVDITSIMPSNIHIRFECTMEHGGARYQAQRTFIYIEVYVTYIISLSSSLIL